MNGQLRIAGICREIIR